MGRTLPLQLRLRFRRGGACPARRDSASRDSDLVAASMRSTGRTLPLHLRLRFRRGGACPARRDSASRDSILVAASMPSTRKTLLLRLRLRFRRGGACPARRDSASRDSILVAASMPSTGRTLLLRLWHPSWSRPRRRCHQKALGSSGGRGFSPGVTNAAAVSGALAPEAASSANWRHQRDAGASALNPSRQIVKALHAKPRRLG